MKPRTGIRKFALLAVAFAVAVISALSQTPLPAKKPSFEVVSIKPSAPGRVIYGGNVRNDRFAVPAMTLRNLLVEGYGSLLNSQIIGGPGWIYEDRFDVEAKADCGAGPIDTNQLRLMFQLLLEDRFKLRAHVETRRASDL
jgi:uncharacterized protein (TIGR03435 family)